jgi:hypothetical protein
MEVDTSPHAEDGPARRACSVGPHGHAATAALLPGSDVASSARTAVLRHQAAAKSRSSASNRSLSCEAI